MNSLALRQQTARVGGGSRDNHTKYGGTALRVAIPWTTELRKPGAKGESHLRWHTFTHHRPTTIRNLFCITPPDCVTR